MKLKTNNVMNIKNNYGSNMKVNNITFIVGYSYIAYSYTTILLQVHGR